MVLVLLVFITSLLIAFGLISEVELVSSFLTHAQLTSNNKAVFVINMLSQKTASSPEASFTGFELDLTDSINDF